ncbi:hypothetical protein [Oscillatoria sp. FACHB-1406]|uniref:hypothetical protein n=1 Tax=Oscillatoria sp. FACHB-1406 TaxID=2692846 RepID=UPI001685CE2F|nr:hypothetical protein [Oscillatoria sp. FACHB-1406]MBD2580332.1 hypothetical protein [Oscillatoria sp. FACHB-1406]
MQHNFLTPINSSVKTRTGAIALALMAFVLPACTDTKTGTNPDTSETTPAATPSNPTLEDVANKSDQLFGQTVTVRGNPDKKIDNTSFTVTNKDFFGGDKILVVNATGQPFVFPEEGTEIQVTGEVRQFNAFDFKKEYNLDWKPAENYDKQPTIVAKSMVPAPAPGEVTSSPNKFYSKTVAVEGDVAEVVNNGTFTLDEDKLVGGSNLTVINLAEPEKTVAKDERVVVTGEVRPFVLADLEKDYKLTWDEGLKKEIETQYKDKPVLIATGIYPMPKK